MASTVRASLRRGFLSLARSSLDMVSRSAARAGAQEHSPSKAWGLELGYRGCGEESSLLLSLSLPLQLSGGSEALPLGATGKLSFMHTVSHVN